MAQINNFYEVSELLSCSGQITEAQIKELAAKKYRVIINLGLLDTLYALKDEKASVKASGITYYHIPVLFENPQITDLASFIEKMNKNAGKKIHVHCAANYRGICFTGLWLFYKGLKTEEEMTDMIEDMWHPDSIWQAFIEEGVSYIETQKLAAN